MPITNMGSWKPTMEAFDQHWGRSDAALAPRELMLTGGVDRALFQLNASKLNAAIDAVYPLVSDAEVLSSQREREKSGLHDRALQYNSNVRGVLAGSSFERMAPHAPQVKDGYDTFFAPLTRIREDWTKIEAMTPQTESQYGVNNFTGPFLLTGGYTLAQFIADYDALQRLWPVVEAAQRDATYARDERDGQMPLLREEMKQYRSAVPGQLAGNAAIIDSIPRLTPPPGETPPPPVVTGMWDAQKQRAVFVVEPTDNPKVARVNARVVPGGKYVAEDEHSVGNIPPTQTRFETDEGLSQPGSTASYKFYNIGPYENEAGGKTIVIERPLEL